MNKIIVLSSMLIMLISNLHALDNKVSIPPLIGMCGDNINTNKITAVDIDGHSWEAQFMNSWNPPSSPIPSGGAAISALSSGYGAYAGDESGTIYYLGTGTYDIWYKMHNQPGTSQKIVALSALHDSTQVYAADDKGTVYVSSALSLDKGWTKMGEVGGQISAMTIGAESSYSTHNYVFIGTNKGNMWFAGNQILNPSPSSLESIPSPTITSITAIASEISTPYVFMANELGETWVANLADGRNLQWRSIPKVTGHPTVLYVTGDGNQPDKFVFMGDSKGNTWFRDNDGNTNGWIELPTLPNNEKVISFTHGSMSTIMLMGEHGNRYERDLITTYKKEPWKLKDSTCLIRNSMCFNGCCPTGLRTDNNYLINHDIFILSYSPHTKFLDWVGYRVEESNIGGPKRPRNWQPDADIPAKDRLTILDYDGAYKQCQYDKGHQVPLADFDKNNLWENTNILSNVAPQKYSLNRGPWLMLENAERNLARIPKYNNIYILVGPYYNGAPICQLPHASKPIIVPNGYWKIITVLDDKTKKASYAAFYFDQATPPGNDYCKHLINIDKIEQLTQLALYPNYNYDKFGESETLVKDLGC